MGQYGRRFYLFSNRSLKSSLIWQELCSEYRNYVRNGRLPCTRENDPIEGPDGRIHGNTCSMCEAFLWVEPWPLLLPSIAADRPGESENDDAESFLWEVEMQAIFAMSLGIYYYKAI